MNEKLKEIIEGIVASKAAGNPDLEKKGAKISASNMAHLNGVKKHLAAAGDFFGKAADAYPDDSNISNGMAHHAAAMEHCMKMDAGPHSTGGEVGDTGVDDAAAPSKAGAGQKVAKTVEQVDFAKAIEQAKAELKGEFEKQVKDLTDKNHELEIENAKLATRIELMGSRPAPAKAIVGLPTFKSQGAEGLVRAASRDGGPATEIDVTKIDKKDPQGFRKALTAVMSKPQRLTREMASRFGNAG